MLLITDCLLAASWLFETHGMQGRGLGPVTACRLLSLDSAPWDHVPQSDKRKARFTKMLRRASLLRHRRGYVAVLPRCYASDVGFPPAVVSVRHGAAARQTCTMTTDKPTNAPVMSAMSTTRTSQVTRHG